MVGRITSVELKALLDADEEFVLVDTRRAEDHEAFHVCGARNVRFAPDDPPDDDALRSAFDDVGEDERIVLICAKGISAAEFVERLDALGYGNVQMVDGGMVGWSTVYDAVTLPVGDGVEVIQLQRRAKGCLGYVVGSAPDGGAAVVDPTRHTDAFLDAAADAGYDVEAVFDTHVHADHVSGGPALADELGVPYYLGASTEERSVEHDHRTVAPNETVTVGSTAIKSLATPGHTAGSTSLLVDGAAVLTADTLHADGVGRVELAFEESEEDSDGDDGSGDDAREGGGAAEGARLLYRSLHRTLLALPDDLAVYPGHVTVTADGEHENAVPGTPVGSSIGKLRRGLDALALDERAFVRRLTENLPEKPPSYERIVRINRGVEPAPEGVEAEQLELGPNNCGA